MELWTVAPGPEEGVDVVVCFDEFSAVTGFDGVGLDVVCINNIENDDVVVALVGGDWEASSLIGEELSVDFCYGEENHVSFVILWSLVGWFYGVRWWGAFWLWYA